MSHERNESLNVVGQSVQRRDGLGHVTGTTHYYEDLNIRGLLHLKMVRSPIPHGKIKGIDFSAAEQVPGFVMALTHKDVPHNIYWILRLIGLGPDDEPVLAEDKVRWKGEPIAAIIAESEAAAGEAAAKTKVDLEELPAVFDPEEALKPGAPIIAATGVNYYIYDNGMDHRQIRFGDVEAAFAQADHIVEGRYQSRPIEHAPTETTGCIAIPEADGRVTVHTNTQALFFSLDNTAITLDIPFEKLHFVGGTVGGGFGGKVDVIVEQIATLAALKTKRPVKFKFSRSEEMQCSSPRGAWRFYYKDGVMKDGRIIARQVTTYADSGAYNRHTPYAITKHCANAAGPYNIPNVSVDAYCVYTNKTPSSAMRGFGVTMSTWAIEQQMDKIAETCGISPWDVRFINAYRDGDIKPHQKVVEDATLIEVMQAAARMAGVDLPEAYKQMSSQESSSSRGLHPKG
jgi:CO/xanthine dehydrogenase Mo-binding subunit